MDDISIITMDNQESELDSVRKVARWEGWEKDNEVSLGHDRRRTQRERSVTETWRKESIKE